MDEYKALNSLEKRVHQLEKKIIGKVSIDEIKASKVKPVIDVVHEVDTVLLSTLSGREKITSLLKKVYILEKILNPSYLEVDSNSETKVEAILESERDLISISDSLTRFNELEPTLNSDGKELTSVSSRVNNLISNLFSIKEECEKQTAAVQRLVVEYKEAMIFLNKLFVQLEHSITELENNA